MQSIEMAVIPAAGRGTRMRAVSGGGPKELLPVAGEPAIVHALREVGLAKIPEAAVVLRPGKEAVRRAVERHLAHCPDSAPEHGLRVGYPVQPDQLGECDAIAQAREAAGGGPIAVFYPDNIPRPPGALARLTQAFRRQPCDLVALSRVSDENRGALSCSGRVDLARQDALGGLTRIRAFLPKSSGPFEPRFPHELRTCGIYLALPRYFEFIETARGLLRPGEELTDGKVRRLMLEAKTTFYGLPLPGEVHDVGLPTGYARAVRMLGPSSHDVTP